jgi:hypothetical protein
MTKLCECGCREPTWIADRNDVDRRWVKGYPIRFIRGHNSKNTDTHPNYKYGVYFSTGNGHRWYVRCRGGKKNAILSKRSIKGWEPYYKETGHLGKYAGEVRTRKYVVLVKGTERLEFKSAASASKHLGLSSAAVSMAIRSGCRTGNGWIPSYKERT